MVPTPTDVAVFLGRPEDPSTSDKVAAHLDTVTAMVRAYTRGRGFDTEGEPADDLAAVILTATARMLANPEQVEYTVGGVRVGPGFAGWSLAETFVLNRYRKRSA